jgi:hypothetical protein
MVRYDAEYVGWMPDYLIAVTRLTKVAWGSGGGRYVADFDTVLRILVRLQI